MMLFYGVFVVLILTNNFVWNFESNFSRQDQELIVASSKGDVLAILQSIKDKANPNAYDSHGMTALHWAVENGHQEAAEFLINNAKVNVNAKDFFLNTPLHIACSFDNLKMIRLLLMKGADYSELNLSDVVPFDLCSIKDQVRPLIHTATKKAEQFIKAIKNGNIQLIQQIFAQGVNVNTKLRGTTALYEAITTGQTDLSAWLIENGANGHEKTPDGSSTLYELAAAMNMPLPQRIERHSAIQRAKKYVHEWLQENPPQEEIAKITSQNGHALTWQAYHRLNDIFWFLHFLSTKYSSLCQLLIIGYSHENRPLILLRISNGNPINKAIWIDGGIHARERISPAAVTYIANDLVINWDKHPEYIRNINWYILSVHNPDGYEYAFEIHNRFWRKNRNPTQLNGCSGVDLNRNYGYNWGKAHFLHNPCGQEYAGTHAFSEPETEAVRRFFYETTEKFAAFLTVHSFGQFILYPTETNKVLYDHENLDRVAQIAVKNIERMNNQKYTSETDTTLDYCTPGSSETWARSIGIEYTYVIELRDKGRYGFLLPTRYIEPTAQDGRTIVWTVAQAIDDDLRKGRFL